MAAAEQESIRHFFAGKSTHTTDLFNHLVAEFEKLGAVKLEATKSMIAIDNGTKRIAWVTQLGKNFVHVVFPFHQPFEDNLCFSKIGQVPGSRQFNHHLRLYHKSDVNHEVRGYMQLALTGAV